MFRQTTAESGEAAVWLEPYKLVMCLHLAKIMIDGKVNPNEIISYKWSVPILWFRRSKPQNHIKDPCAINHVMFNISFFKKSEMVKC